MDTLVNHNAIKILEHALESVLPTSAMRNHLNLDQRNNLLNVDGRPHHLNSYDEIIVVGGGKGALQSGAELASILGNRISKGALNVYLQQADKPFSKKVQLFPAYHPKPNQSSVIGAQRMVELLQASHARTLVIALISGGGSSLITLPSDGISLQDYQRTTDLLLSVPASIDEINAVRKHIDQIKGGGMRKFAQNAGMFITVVLSDVPVSGTGIADDPSVIASGPTVGDDSSFFDARQVCRSW